jgi:tetrahydrodipicolinate N-succinyltransferase
MTTQQEVLFNDLNALTEEQIEAGLAAGVWRENRPFVKQYLEQIKLSRSDAVIAAQGLEAIRSVADNARAADFRATIAIVVAAGAMLAAMAAAAIAFMALSGMTISW